MWATGDTPHDDPPRDALELDDALARCYRHIARREHSTAELRAKLARTGLSQSAVEEALAIVTEQGYLDDDRYARLLAHDRRELDGWGTQRIRARLQDAGIATEVIERVLAPHTPVQEHAAALQLLRRRFPGAPSTNRERQRAYEALIRQGFESELAYEAIRAHERDAA
jgi:regulatory protein